MDHRKGIESKRKRQDAVFEGKVPGDYLLQPPAPPPGCSIPVPRAKYGTPACLPRTFIMSSSFIKTHFNENLPQTSTLLSLDADGFFQLIGADEPLFNEQLTKP